MRCPSQADLGRAFSTGPDAALADHLGGCALCASRWRGFEQLRVLARRLPELELDERARDRVRAAIVAGAAVSRHRRRLGLGVAAALVALVAGLVAFQIRGGGLRAEVRSLPGAVFEHLGPTSDERVRLHDGTVAVEVTALHPGERFRVVTGDAEVEVRGTAFEVVAAGDRLLAVRVSHGKVAVRPAGGGATLLQAGETWAQPPPAPRVGPAPPRAEAPASPAIPRAAVGPAPPPPAVAGGSSPAPVGDLSPTEAAFDEGFADLRNRDPEAAALAFGRAAAGSGELAEDAAFWQGVALRRAGQEDAALAAFVTFLQRYPMSPRAGEAAVAAGWLELDAGHADEAAAHFRSAVGDPSARVRAGAADGLRAATTQ